MHYEEKNRPAFTELTKKIEQACATRYDKTFPIDDSLSNLESFKRIETTDGFTPEECIELGKKHLANGQISSAIASFNTAEKTINQGNPLWGCLHYYRYLAYSRKGKENEAAHDYKKAKESGFNKVTIPLFEILTTGKRVKPGLFLVGEKGSLFEWQYAQRVAIKADKFFDTYAKILWYHFRNQNQEVAQEITNESKEEILSELENYLIGLKKDFNKKTIQEIRKLVSDELDMPVEPTKNASPFISDDDKPESERRRTDENYTLADIYELYLKYTDITDRQIQFNIALVLDAVDFWSERIPGKGNKQDKYARRLKERWNDIKSISLNLKNGHKYIDDQHKVCPS